MLRGGPRVFGPEWVPAFAPDGDGLAGIAFPTGVSGNDILLATITFSGDAVGETDLFLSTTPQDLTEGFGLDPTGFAEVSFAPGHVEVIPEPASVSLLVVCCLVVFTRKPNR